MAEYDGTIRIDTHVDTAGVEKSLDKVGSSVKKTFDGVLQGVADAGGEAGTKVSGVLSKAFNAASKAAAGISTALSSVVLVIGTIVAAIAFVVLALASAAVGLWDFLTAYAEKIESITSKTSYLHEEVSEMNQKFADMRNQLAVMFTPLLIVAMPIMMKIVAWLTRIVTLVQSIMAAFLGQKTIMQYVAGSTEAAAKAAKGFGGAMGDASKAAKGALAAFDEINVLQMQEEGGGGGGDAGAEGTWNEVPIESKVLDTVQKIKDWFRQAWEDVKSFAISAWSKISEIAVQVWDKIKEKAKEFWDNVLVPLWGKIVEIATNVWNFLREHIFNPIGDKLKWFGEIAKRAWETFRDEFILKIAGAVERALAPKIQAAIDYLKTAFEGFKVWVGVLWDKIKKDVQDVWKFIVDVFTTVVDTIVGVINGVITIFGGIITFLTGVFTRNWALAWEGVKTIVKGVWDTIYSVIKGVINLIIDIINAMIRSVANGINAVIDLLSKINITIPSWVPLLGGSTWKIDIPQVVPPQIPKLAAGGVIPPNASFLAMMGDQTSGKNIEAPESLIRQIIQEELGEVKTSVEIKFGGSIGALVRELKPFIDKENTRVGKSLVKGSIT